MATKSEALFGLVNDEIVQLEGDALNELLQAQNSVNARLAAEAAEAEAKAQAKAALLERLGITEDEARLLLA